MISWKPVEQWWNAVKQPTEHWWKSVKHWIRKVIYLLLLYTRLPKGLIIGLVVALYGTIVIDLNLEALKMPELFHNGHRLEGLLYQLSIGYLVSFLFYYIVVFVNEARTRGSFKVYLNHTIKGFYLEIFQIVMALRVNRNTPEKFILGTDAEIQLLFNTSRPIDQGFIFRTKLRNGTLADQMEGLYPYYQKLVSEVSLRSKMIDPKLDSILTFLEFGTGLFFFLKNNPINRDDISLSFIGTIFLVFLGSLRTELSEYCYKMYGIERFDDFCNSKKKTL